MTYFKRINNLITPNPDLPWHDTTPQDLTKSDWEAIFTEMGFVDDNDPYPNHKDSQYSILHFKHRNDLKLRLSYTHPINLITISINKDENSYLYPVDYDSLRYGLDLLLNTIRGLYATHH